jgi:hypothetical protein
MMKRTSNGSEEEEISDYRVQIGLPSRMLGQKGDHLKH